MLSTGTRLGPYEIVSPLGAGGMGEVYRARDTRLGRDVAVKVLPAHLSANPEIRARFEREAKTVSSLNHPYICTLFDVGREGETDYLVMELVEGETLATHLIRGAMSAAELLRVGAQVAEALERAHRAGVIHRDMKPGNIMLTKAGAKLMDFGLARATGMAGPAGGSGVTVAALTQTPTVGQALTVEGTLLGTYQYMSPEQLEGHEADARSDIWALGCVLYEMATGRRAFEGRSQASLIAAILERQPAPVGEGSPASGAGAASGPPAGLDGLIHDCLAKDPDERVQTAHDIRLRLQRIAQSAGLSISSTAVPSSSGGGSGSLAAPVIVRKTSPVPWAVTAALLVALAGFAAFALPRLAAKPPVFRFQPDVTPPGVTGSRWPRLSPDGRQLLFQGGDSSNVSRAYVLRLDESVARPVVGTEGLQRAYWSPNGKEIVFCAGNRMLRIAIEGGSPTVVCPAPGGADLSWGRKGVILMDGSSTDSLRQVPAGGGELRPASRIDRKAGENGAAWPCFLPDGERFVYVGNLASGADYGNIRIGRLGSLDSKKIGTTSGRVEYAPGGWLVFPKGTSLVAQKLDERHQELTGEPIVLCENLTLGNALGNYSVSPAGPLAVMRGEGGGFNELRITDRTGSIQPGVVTTGTIGNPQFSPDGHRVLYERRGPAGSPYGDVFVHDLDRDVDTRLTFTDGVAVGPHWSPDGRRFAVTIVGTHPKVLIGQADGMGAVDSVACPGVQLFLSQWADGGKLLAYDNGTGVWVADLSTPAHKFEKLPGCDGMLQGALSPDGAFIAGVLGGVSNYNIFVQSLGAQPGRWQISSSTLGFGARWVRGGRELLYETRDGHLMSVDCDPSHGFQVGTPKLLFPLPIASFSEYVSSWGPSPDGSRFLAVVPSRARAASRNMEVVTRFDALVHRK